MAEKSINEEMLEEMELQTDYLQKINGKLGFIQTVIIVMIVLTILGFILR